MKQYTRNPQRSIQQLAAAPAVVLLLVWALACGPASVPTPEYRCTVLPQELQDYWRDRELPDDMRRQEDNTVLQCFEIEPTFAPKYPALGNLTFRVQDMEKEQAASGTATRDRSPNMDVEWVFIRIGFDTEANRDAAFAWLSGQLAGQVIYSKSSLKHPTIDTEVPLSLLVSISEREGFKYLGPIHQNYSTKVWNRADPTWISPIPQVTPTPALQPTRTPHPHEQEKPTPPPVTPHATFAPNPIPATPIPRPPNLIIVSPVDRSIIQEGSVAIHGITSVGASVTVQGRSVAAGEEGRFRLSVPLTPGVNTLDIFTTNPDGHRQKKTLTVIHRPGEPLFLTIMHPPERDITVTEPTIRLRGKTTPGATIAINETAFPVDGHGMFTITIPLQPGQNRLDVRSTHPTGAVLSQTVTVDYEPPQP